MKKLLLIGLRYHSYTNDIIFELSRLGYAVKFYEIQPRTLFYKSLPVISPALLQHQLNRHHETILNAEAGQSYDVVLFIQAHQFSVNNIDILRRQHAKSRFVLYNWDSLTTHDYRPQLHVFDKAFTFDSQDATDLGINYLPLFCVRAFQNLKQVRQDEGIVYFVGNVVSIQRYRALRAFGEYCSRENIPFNRYLACTPRVVARLVANGYFPSDISFASIAQPRFIEMVESATTVFDFANHTQAGYTMRTIENLCAKKKLITNNQYIRRELFCTPDRIHVFEGLDFSGVKAFLSRKIATPSEIFDEYHIQNFVHRLVS
jgi:hypothetical protein